MGHGVRAALVAMILRTLVEDLRVHAADPAKFLQELNRGISRI
jgi:serine phosphatase RsbU (regulator of sigma subunit)